MTVSFVISRGSEKTKGICCGDVARRPAGPRKADNKPQLWDRAMAERRHALAVPWRLQRHLLGVPHIATGLLPVQVSTRTLGMLPP